jgi:hypothetical protein
MKCLVCALFLSILLGKEAKANNRTAASCSTSDVQTQVTASGPGDTVIIPAGTCTWTSGITISGIKIQGSGSGRIIAYDNGTEVLTIGTGTLTMTIAGYSPGFSASSISNGETLQIFEKNNRSNYMRGTVTSLSGSTLTMSITSTNGSGSTHRWLIATLPSTTIIFNAGSKVLFNVNESTTNTTSISGIQFSVGSNSACCSDYYIQNNYTTGGQPILIHDNYFQSGTAGLESIQSNTNRGVIWNNSFEGSSYSRGMLVTVGGYRTKIGGGLQSGQNAWLQPSYWGTLDTTGTNNVYVETNDFHTMQAAADNDDNARTVWRNNLMDEATFSTHGADTSPYGERYFEFYNNKLVHNEYSDSTTFNLPNGWVGQVRGGTGVYHDNTHVIIGSGTDYPTPVDLTLRVYPLQQNYNGAYPAPADRDCWGTGTTGGTHYPAPRQVGFGRVTGTGTAPLSPPGPSADSITYVGDSEPLYAWNNGGAATASVGTFSPNQCTNPDSPSNYIVEGRDYFTNTPKPGYTPYTYPHPLTLGQSSGNSPVAPTQLTATVQ